jgi:hypothetical protein
MATNWKAPSVRQNDETVIPAEDCMVADAVMIAVEDLKQKRWR